MSIANNQTLAARIAPVGVLDQEAVDFRFDGCLEHLAGSFMNDRVQSAPTLKGLSELDHFRVDCFVRTRSGWCLDRRRCTVSHGVSLCLVAAEELLPSAGYAAFLHLSKNTTFDNSSGARTRFAGF
jgi:hypothetical protein